MKGKFFICESLWGGGEAQIELIKEKWSGKVSTDCSECNEIQHNLCNTSIGQTPVFGVVIFWKVQLGHEIVRFDRCGSYCTT